MDVEDLRVNVLLLRPSALHPGCSRSVLAKANWSVVILVAEKELGGLVIRIFSPLSKLLLLPHPESLLPLLFLLDDILVVEFLLPAHVHQLLFVPVSVVHHVVVQALQLVLDLRLKVIHGTIVLCLALKVLKLLLLL